MDREVFYTLLEVKVLTEQHRQVYNRVRPNSSGLQTAGAEAVLPSDLVPMLAGVT